MEIKGTLSKGGLAKGNLNAVFGKDGYTPVKGVDYYTEEEKAEIVNDVLDKSKQYTDDALENKLDKVTDANKFEVYGHMGAEQKMFEIDFMSVSDNSGHIPASSAVKFDLSMKVNKTDVKDALTSSDPSVPLSANQGRLLDEKIGSVAEGLNSLPIYQLDASKETVDCNNLINEGLYFIKGTPLNHRNGNNVPACAIVVVKYGEYSVQTDVNCGFSRTYAYGYWQNWRPSYEFVENSDLNTENKTIVGAINELNTTIVGAINELNEIKQNKWELIESKTLENGIANVITVNFSKQYQEFFIRFVVPSINATTKGRVSVIAYNSANKATTIFSETGDLYPEATTGTLWYLNFFIKRFGNFVMVERNWGNDGNAIKYAHYNNHSKTIGMTIGDIAKLGFSMIPTATRWFPVGTTYEVWGVEQ